MVPLPRILHTYHERTYMPPSHAVPESFQEARGLLNHARRMRGHGNVEKCEELAGMAYMVAYDIGDYETLYQARACVGRMHRYRAEHDKAYAAYRNALREVESGMEAAAQGWDVLMRWLGPALHDCFVEAMMMGDRDEAAPYGRARMDVDRQSPQGIFAFTQDVAYLRLLRREEDATFLRQTAVQATWYANTSFERMCLFASQAYAAGSLRHERWFDDSRRRFDHAVSELNGIEEGVAMQALDVACGAEAMGYTEMAMDYAASARHVARNRGETVLHDRAQAIMLRLGAPVAEGDSCANAPEAAS